MCCYGTLQFIGQLWNGKSSAYGRFVNLNFIAVMDASAQKKKYLTYCITKGQQIKTKLENDPTWRD
ncbi:uncharacterized protein SPAPADRAFT_60015 [Spathaspora passalidarum NRRL Y-27907]|uniref:Uncharacterized protein n=1 Tax=Spathaspora passalidarum (strain NRRL Y-27907 / 11-Y1) TaxID=619300 RepID=G3AJC5_SPAPN|nr:uncharacterized protein SPAPADRAFT_60015 [Spathaspora passalidarum NRRL Y-27907]EGW34584.1 hypothetical protein SPAPADRAFT_60015 [Spathaspora passalidarum NRRL Y-27907]